MSVRKQWKVAEQRLASLFNTKRRPLSGSNHGTGRGDDAMHNRLYLESKYGAQDQLVCKAWELYCKTRDQCNKDTKGSHIPVIGLQRTSRPGILLVVHSSNLEALAKEYLTQIGYTIEGSKRDTPPATSGEVAGLPTVPPVKKPSQSRPVPRLSPGRRTVHRRGSRTK